MVNHNKDYKQLESEVMINVYGRTRETTPYFVSGKGTKLSDDQGEEYLDFLSGLGVCNLGHAHNSIVKKAKAQLETLMHTSNLYYTGPQIELASKLVDNSFGDKVFFANSGAEANEAAIKLARKYSYNKYGTDRQKIITVHSSFHGRTLATLTATGQEKVKTGFQPLPDGFTSVPVNDINAIKTEIDESTCAVLLEPVLGEGGVYPLDQEYLEAIKEICEKNDILLIFDEIQTGMGRTGKLFAHENYNITPDIMSLAKALGGGLPIGAIVATEQASSGFSPGDHATTFGGNPVICAAGNAVMDILLTDGFLDQVTSKANYLHQQLQKLAFSDKVTEIRQLGMMVGIEIKGSAKELKSYAEKQGLIINAIGDNIIRLLPPVIVTEKEIDFAIDIITTGLAEIS